MPARNAHTKCLLQSAGLVVRHRMRKLHCMQCWYQTVSCMQCWYQTVGCMRREAVERAGWATVMCVDCAGAEAQFSTQGAVVATAVVAAMQASLSISGSSCETYRMCTPAATARSTLRYQQSVPQQWCGSKQHQGGHSVLTKQAARSEPASLVGPTVSTHIITTPHLGDMSCPDLNSALCSTRMRVLL